MRSLAIILATPMIACGSGGYVNEVPDAPAADPGFPPPAHGFQIVTPNVDIPPGKEVTYCFYFHTPNAADVVVQRWASRMTPGSHHMILYLTPTDQQTPGTLSTSLCGIANGSFGPVWTYSAQSPDAELALPTDDGAGHPVGQSIRAGQSGFIQMHYLNATDAVIHAHVALNAYTYNDGAQVTPAGPFVTFYRGIDLAPGSPTIPTPGMVSGTCPVPNDTTTGKSPRFYVMTTHTHKQGVHSFIKDGPSTVFDTTSWEHPGAATWDAAPFYSFTSGTLFYQCEYSNPNNYRIQTGDSAATDEMCMAVGYYFPATDGKGHFCLNSLMVY
ncbi:MAG: hypothetical protein E6J91_39495 [Deltaproteobacteria bacterium]|nr:MAG: hypothetical protein E6J91_39495 [Deltaproteobacteria bacterium]